MPRGGRRPGAGRPSKEVLEQRKRALREAAGADRAGILREFYEFYGLPPGTRVPDLSIKLLRAMYFQTLVTLDWHVRRNCRQAANDMGKLLLLHAEVAATLPAIEVTPEQAREAILAACERTQVDEATARALVAQWENTPAVETTE